jgi:hypothetical protein
VAPFGHILQGAVGLQRSLEQFYGGTRAVLVSVDRSKTGKRASCAQSPIQTSLDLQGLLRVTEGLFLVAEHGVHGGPQGKKFCQGQGITQVASGGYLFIKAREEHHPSPFLKKRVD